MTSERIQRHIGAFLDQAETAMDAGEWGTVAEKASAVLSIANGNADARAFPMMAGAGLPRAARIGAQNCATLCVTAVAACRSRSKLAASRFCAFPCTEPL